jgi:hypothetical protein
MSPRFLSSLFLLAITTGCADLSTGRSYLTEMEQDDAHFFSPRKDFPVLAGDSGQDWMSESERKRRTPASQDDIMEDRTSRALKAELRQLEGLQSEDSLELYNQYKHLLSGISGKIFFLKLPPRERKDYLMTKGLLAQRGPASETPFDKLAPRASHDIFLGMNKNEVLASMGKPFKVEVAGNPRNENERWLYRFSSRSKYIYFESGRVEGWE